jgi:hypothetical protein
MNPQEDWTSLWSVIEGMQSRLEAEGLDDEVVDIAVSRAFEALFRKRPRRPDAWLASQPVPS